MRLKTLPVAIAIALSSLASQANATPLLSFDSFAYTSANTGTLTPETVSGIGKVHTSNHSYITNVDLNAHTVIVNALPGIAGSIDTYKDVTTTTATETSRYSTDSYAYSVAGNAGNFDVNQWIMLSGTVTAAQNTTLSYSMSATGNYLPTVIPGIGSVIPALPSLYFGYGTHPLAPVNTQAYTSTSNEYSVYSGNYFTLTGGTTTAFTGMVYTGGAASLKNFSLNLFGEQYDSSYNVTYADKIVSTKLSSVVIPAIPLAPVPEPETYGMLLMGLGFMGFITRRRRNDV